MKEKEKTFTIKIIDNNDWQPDLDFGVELYDPSSPDGKMSRLYGNDTFTRITILDEDFPGTLKFDET